MGTPYATARADSKLQDIVSACLLSMNDPRVPLSPALQAAGVVPAEINRIYKKPITLDTIARLLNYHFPRSTFAVIRKEKLIQLVRLASGNDYTPTDVVREFPDE